ncbi:type I polyketide synthase [Streptomyces sp. Rer75]|uniref:SDR family NAD(P)-dependent oxidoreductase n=1 Tax=Streptomyces sp. Rer75 TaxID=2750011 RepID=UPI0015CF95EC|nr:type I polyketide synthase [Streptomyces sp. Rer75]QLH25626.1 SDR family NAD(P)-dependent oxidoreductase [Streptomyces sp. Rer75]
MHVDHPEHPAPDTGAEGLLDIAVVGMDCRFPGAGNPEEYWRLIRDGVEAVSRFDEAELRAAGVAEDIIRHPEFVGAAGLVPDGDAFDADFFGYTPAEAAMLDPQQRIFLECAWRALEDAGHDPAGFPGDIGVFAGQTVSTHQPAPLEALLTSPMDVFQQISSNDKDFLPTRVCHKLGLTGPGINVQTACSTSLVAVHLAAQSLLAAECDMALAGGVSWTALRPRGYRYQPGGIMSPDGHCRPFDADAGGFVPADGAGVVVLRRLADALADGDRIYAVLKGSAVNNDGADKVGYTAPGLVGQQRVVAQALANADVHPDTVGYVEAHGTATRLGDPVELSALTRAYRSRGATETGRCAVGSVKANIGHTDVAAGIAGFLKAVLVLHHGHLPPSVNLSRVGDELDVADSPFRFDREGGQWKPGDGPRRAAVSAFGIGGTNAHAILQEAPAAPRLPSGRPWHLITLSARDETALRHSAAACADSLEAEPEADLGDVCHTLAGRHPMRRRLATVVPDRRTALDRLRAGRTPALLYGDADAERPDATVFLFPGGGAHYAGMGRGLYEDEPVFRRALDDGLDLLPDPELRARIREALSARGDRATGAPDPLADPVVGLPALFLTETALGEVLQARGVRPTVFLGHSLGEYAAAYFAGVFEKADALSVVVRRGEILSGISGGAMLSVAASEEEIRRRLTPQLSLSVVNGERMCVISGPGEAIEAARAGFTADGIDCRRVPIATAAHSALVDPALPGFRSFLDGIPLRPPSRPLISNVTGRLAGDEVADPGYWVDHLRGTVRFADGLAAVTAGLGAERPVFVEVGPGTTLSTVVRAHPRTERATVVHTLPHPDAPSEDSEVLLGALGGLWVSGADVDPAALYADETRTRQPSVRYPFTRRTFAPAPSARETPAAPGGTPAGGAPAGPGLYAASWQRTPPPPAPRATPPGRPLVLADASPLAGQVLRHLTAQGANPLVARAGAADCTFHRDGHAYVLDPADPDQCARLLTAAREEHGAGGPEDGAAPLRILDLWSGSSNEEPVPAGFLALAHALGRTTAPAELTLVTRAAFDVTGAERPVPVAACLAGAAHVLPLELEHVRLRVADIDPGERAETELRALAATLTAETTAERGADPVAAYRGGHRWTRRFMPLARGGDAPALVHGGTYLITGGLGGAGRHLAAHLAERHAARLVLVGRGAEDSDALDGDPRILVRRADVTDRARMAEVLREARARFGALDGVVHAAAAPGGGMLQFLTPQDLAEGLSAKVTGAYALVDALDAAGERPGFLALFSSLGSFAGSVGLAAYCAGNAFLDTFAVHASRTLGIPALSLDWDRWQGTGMARDVERRHRELTSRDLAPGLDPSHACELFTEALGHLPVHQLAVSLRPPDELLAGPGSAGSEPHGAGAPIASGDVTADGNGVVEGDERELAVLRIWEETLGVSGIGLHDNFFVLGGHSLMAMRIAQRFNDRFGTAATAQDLFTSPTAAGLARLAGDDRTPTPNGRTAREPEEPA